MKMRQNRRKSKIRYLEKEDMELCQAPTIKPRQIECSWIYRLVSGQSNERLLRKRDLPMKDDDFKE